MLLGSSYSLIINENKEDNIIIPDFDKYYHKEMKISINNNRLNEYNFEIINESGSDIKYRIDIIPSSNNKLNKMINYSYILNNYESDLVNLNENSNIIKNQLLSKNMKDIYKISFSFIDIYDSLYPFETIINIYAYKDDFEYATKSLENKNSNDLELVNNELRFVSNNPNNYVWFNCNNDYCEKWRIIGVFDVNVENSNKKIKSLKIMKENSNDQIWFNKDELNGKFNNSFANSYLNGAYYEKLSDQAKKLILKVPFNIGDVNIFDYENAYKEEKKEQYYANVGLLNPSDYLLLKNNWMIFDKKILLMNKNGNYVNVIKNGITFDDSNLEYDYIPVVYLKEEVSFIDGDGSIDNPYHLDIINPYIY